MYTMYIQFLNTTLCIYRWQKLYKASQEDYGSISSLFARIGRPKAKKPKDDMHACQDALLTVFKGHMVAAACKEIDIEGNVH